MGQIRITVKKGKVTIDYVGYHGQQCFDAENRLLSALKSVKVRDKQVTLKSEYYENEEENQYENINS